MALSYVSLILTPIALVAGYTLYRLAVGRPLQRHTTDMLFALLLLTYFAATAGLGIFWVANQELPVFDVHYLFGYATLALVALHLVLNWRTVVLFFQRRPAPPQRAATPRAWRPALKVAGWASGLLLYGGVCFWLGQRQGAARIEVTMRPSPPDPAAPAPLAARAAPVPAMPPTSSAAQPLELGAGDLPGATATAHQIVAAGGRERTLAAYYHEETKHSRLSLLTESPGFAAVPQPDVFKHYAAAARIDLPAPAQESGMSVGAAVAAARRPTLGFTADTLTLNDLSIMLFMTNGITATRRYPGRAYYLRAAPSAGALYPVDTYLIVRNVAGLAPGLYHYAVRDHQLHQIRVDDTLTRRLAALVPQPHYVEQAPATFVFTSTFYRSSWKYRARSYRYCCLDAGHLAVQTVLTAAALGYGSQLIGRFDDRRVNALLELEEHEEGALLIIPVGKRAPDAPAPRQQRAFVLQPQQLSGSAGTVPLLMHGGTYFAATDQEVAPFAARGLADKPSGELSGIALPSKISEGDDLLAAIRRRRSVRRWAEQPLTLAQLSSVLHDAFGFTADHGSQLGDPSVEENHALRLYVVVNDVAGLSRGIYYYRRSEHVLTQLRAGDFRRKAYSASLSQDVVGQCQVLFVMTIDRERCGYPDADRGYRYAGLDAGMRGGRIYLAATGLGLGCCGVGAFFDDDVSKLIGTNPEEELVIYLAAIGVPAEGVED